MKTPEEIAVDATTEFDTLPSSGDELVQLIAKAIEADRAQHVGIYVPATVHPVDALFFREVWIKGESADGTTLEMTRTVGGGALVLEVDRADGTRFVESINASELTRQWAAAAMARA